jgi:4-hydroxy-4-methyl-2-oxoglutarate aldolase
VPSQVQNNFRKGHVVRSIIGPPVNRPPRTVVERLVGVEVTRISDRVGRMYTMDGTIRPLYAPARPVVGVATTVKCPPGDNLAVVKAITLVEEGDVLVIDAQGFMGWCLGGFQLLSYGANTRGLAGAVVNGAYRDIEDAQEAGFPLYGRGIAPFSGPKQEGGEINVPVCCGGVVVHPGDVIAASAEGIAVIPLRAVAAVVEALAPSEDAAPDTRIDDFVRHFADVFDQTRG